jgi:outer membrane protein
LIAGAPSSSVRPLIAAALLGALGARGAETAQPPARVLTLEEAVQAAREHQPQLRQARAGTQAAQARAEEARSALHPQVTATLGYQRTTGNFIIRPGVATGATAAAHSDFDTFNSFSGGITANQLIYDFGQTIGRLHAQEASAAAAGLGERAAQLQNVLAVRGAFFDARANKALAAVAREALENSRLHLDQINEFVKAGTRPDIDLFQARTDLANAQVALINAENAYDASKAALHQAMGLESAADYDVAEDSIAAVPDEDLDLERLLSESIKARPEIGSLEEQVRAQQATIRSIEGAYGPSIGASAGITQGGTQLDHLGWNAQIGVSLTWAIYQGGLTRSQVHEAEANLAGLIAQLDVLRQQLRLEVQQVRLALRAAKSALGAAADALLNARERLKLAETRYQTGVGNVIELGDAQVAVTTAAAQSVQADYKLATARAQLLKALGRP